MRTQEIRFDSRNYPIRMERTAIEFVIYLFLSIAITAAIQAVRFLWGYTLSILKIGVALGGAAVVAFLIYASQI